MDGVASDKVRKRVRSVRMSRIVARQQPRNPMAALR